MALSKAVLWVVMGMIGLTTLACAAAVGLAERSPGDSNSYYLVMFSFLMLALLGPMVVVLHRGRYRLGGAVICGVFLAFWAASFYALMNPTFLRVEASRIFESGEMVMMMGIPTGVGLMCADRKWGKWFAWSLLGVTVVCLPVALMGVWMREYQTQLLGTGMLLFCYGATGSVLLMNVGQHDRRYFRWPGVAAAVWAAVAWVVAMWQLAVPDASLWYLMAHTGWAVSGTAAMVNLVLMTRERGLVRGLKVTAIVMVVLSGAGTVAVIWMENLQWEKVVQAGMWRGMGMALTLMVGAIAAMLTARTMVRMKPKATVPLGIGEMNVVCPNCGTMQRVGLNGSCPKCLLKFRISLAEPRCPACEHLVLNLTSDRCPECGGSIARPAVAS